MSGIPVKLQVFEGPLDLLLHLIEVNKIDIYDIPIVEITDQYMAYIRAMEGEDLNLVSEFMVMAASLIDIKCRMLLPKEINEEGEEEDPRDELVQRLLEYKVFKFMSFELRDKMAEACKSIYRENTMPKEVLAYRPPVDTMELLKDTDLDKLQKVFIAVMKRREDRIDPIRSHFGKIEVEDVSLPERIQSVVATIRKDKKTSFRRLLSRQRSRMQIIVTFLAVLELMKAGSIRIEQESLFDDIAIEATEKAMSDKAIASILAAAE